MYMTVKQAAEKWGISDRRVRILCSEGKIPGVTRDGRSWKIPADVKFHLRTQEDNPLYRTEYGIYNKHLLLTERNG